MYRDLSVLIPAAGAGERLGRGPKALLEIDGRPIIRWLCDKLSCLCDDIIVAAPADLLDKFQLSCPDHLCIAGGNTRQESVEKLVGASTRPWLLLADAARPFASLKLYETVLCKAREHGAAGAFLRPDVPIARISCGNIEEVLTPANAGVFQLPHGFNREQLLSVLRKSALHKWQEQSTLELWIKAGLDVGIVPGEKTNIKLTTSEDWQLATALTEYLK